MKTIFSVISSSVEGWSYTQSLILITKNCHVAHSGTIMCMWGPQTQLKELGTLIQLYHTHPHSFTHSSHPMPTLKLTESTNTSISISIHLKIPVLCIYNTEVTNI